MSVSAEPRTVSGLAALIATRAISAEEATLAAISRAESLQSHLNTFILLEAEGALSAARTIDDNLARGRPVGPLAGVPLAHKDMFYRTRRVVSCGSRLRRDFRPRANATVLTRLDAAGAIDLGGLNMSEFACSPYGFNTLVGRCINPWDPLRIVGGSSSGSACAVAAGIVPAALGSDTGGSIRLPAAINGVCGLVPTYGRVSRQGVMKLSHSLDHVGPIALSVRDCALLLGILAGPDGEDSTCVDLPVPDYVAALDAPVAGTRIGVPRTHFLDNIEPDVRSAWESSLDVFRRLGCRLVPVDPPDAEPIDALANTIILAEAATIHRNWLRHNREQYTPFVGDRIAFGLTVAATDYIEALSLRHRMQADYLARVFADIDVLHAPVLRRAPALVAQVERPGETEVVFDMAHNTRLTNYLCLPSLSVPWGSCDLGLPVSFQLIGRPFDEATLLALGHRFQTETGLPPLAPAATMASPDHPRTDAGHS